MSSGHLSDGTQLLCGQESGPAIRLLLRARRGQGGAHGRRSLTPSCHVGHGGGKVPARRTSLSIGPIDGRSEDGDARSCGGDSVATPRQLDTRAVKATIAKSCRRPKVFSNGNVYVGEWLEGGAFMHGRGLYTWQDGSSYEGQFVYNRLSGRGVKTWPEEGRKYSGDWKEDMMWGEGQLVCPEGESYYGQFRKGSFHGRGTRVWGNGDKYVGDFSNGEQEGSGVFHCPSDGWIFEGSWLHGRMYGEGKISWPDGTVYIGEWQDGIREGNGRLEWPDGSWYEGPFCRNNVEGHGQKAFADGSHFVGDFVDGEFDGHGTFRWPDGMEFEGLWRRSEIAGPGTQRLPDGTQISGTFEDSGATGHGSKMWAIGCVYTGSLLRSQIHSHGTLTWPDGRCYCGQFAEDAMDGQGVLVWFVMGGRCTYRGDFRDNVFEGRGLLEWSSGAKYDGDFQNGQYHGEGSFEWPGGRSMYRGLWGNGEMNGEGALTVIQNDNSSYIYTGMFTNGDMDGHGHVVFTKSQAKGDVKDEYKGEFKASRFNGLGTFQWANGSSLAGIFEDNYCSRVGRKVNSDGSVYTGELRFDLEHGKGVLWSHDSGISNRRWGHRHPTQDVGSAGGSRLVALWEDGKAVKELLMSHAPELELSVLFGGMPPDGRAAGEVPPCPRPEMRSLASDDSTWDGVVDAAVAAPAEAASTQDTCPATSTGSRTPVEDPTGSASEMSPEEAKEALQGIRPQQLRLGVQLTGQAAAAGKMTPPKAAGEALWRKSQRVLTKVKLKQALTNRSQRELLPISDMNGRAVTGKAIIEFLNGDRYIGRLKFGRKHGLGMYVYHDCATYRGEWDQDVLDGVRHPVTEDSLPVQVKMLQEDNKVKTYEKVREEDGVESPNEDQEKRRPRGLSIVLPRPKPNKTRGSMNTRATTHNVYNHPRGGIFAHRSSGLPNASLLLAPASGPRATALPHTLPSIGSSIAE
eukprot:TRINITY_DN47379_c0_g1_i1.p1 TRINITY_DN47379_c0_g1~~TRINITY_DN47379_c0_g1_i1.p1  ORF type:complete len:964 (-),score=175.22 TRINITY_DN47379_c0_g1_i1:218-3109(-)